MDAFKKETKTRARLSDELELLKLICRTWSENEWNSYLTTLDVGLREELVSNPEEINSAEPFSWQGNSSPEQIEMLRNAMHLLSPREKSVIEKIFFKSKSERQVADLLGVSRTTVVNFKKRAIRKLRFSLGVLSSIYPLVTEQQKTGGSKNPLEPEL